MIGVLGGTFDPVHFGHLRIALELYQDLGLEQVRFIPCARPPHRQPPRATAGQRLQMLALAIAGEPAFVLDDREYHRPGPSYMVDTLASLRDEWGSQPLCLIVGSDAFDGLDAWHQWHRLVDLAHLVVAHRPGWRLCREQGVGRHLSARFVDRPQALRQAPAGRVLPWPVSQLAISASAIRALVGAGKSPRYLLPDGVWHYIKQHDLYG